MKHIEIDGARLPALGFGTWDLRGGTCERAVRAALDIGYRHVDTAQMYGNEAEIGRAVAGSGIDRAEIFLTTKVWPDALEPGPLRRVVEDSLRQLRTDHVDLLLIHWPNPNLPLGPTLEAMVRLKDEGKARAIGVSNFTVALMREAVERHGAPIVANQVEYHPFLSQRPVLDYARGHGLAVTAYCPLARGEVVRNPVLARIGERHGKSAAQVGLRWLMEQDRVAAIPRSSSERHARSNFEIFDFELTAADQAEIDGLARGDRKVETAWSPDWDAS